MMDTQSAPQAAQAAAEAAPAKAPTPAAAAVGEAPRPVRRPSQGLRFEWIGDGHYHAVLHFGESFVPAEDHVLDFLSKKRDVVPEKFIELVIERLGTNSYLKSRLRTAAEEVDLKTQGKAMLEFLKKHKV